VQFVPLGWVLRERPHFVLGGLVLALLACVRRVLPSRRIAPHVRREAFFFLLLILLSAAPAACILLLAPSRASHTIVRVHA
jgi:hypothetical protein